MPQLRDTTIIPAPQAAASIEGRASWAAAAVSIALLAVSYGTPLLVVVGLKPITTDLDTARSVIALAGSLTWIGTGLGGICMGMLADRIGIRATVILGAVNMGLGLAVSASGSILALYIGHALLLGFLGNGAVFAPLLIYVSRWFDRRRGTALALISSGQYIAGMVWPSVFERSIAVFGWRATMLYFGVFAAVAIALLAMLFLQRTPPMAVEDRLPTGSRARREVLGLPANLVLALVAAAGFLCCVPMALPQGHLVAFCSDIGIPAAQGAAMLSVLQACAFCSRQFWGWFADRMGGLMTVFAGSACQALAIAAFLMTQDEIGLFAVSAAYGLGFSGIVPAYVLTVRELYPSREAAWRVPTVLFISMSGMAFGTWFAGALYDRYGFYAPAFAIGVVFNLANLAVIGFLLSRQRRGAGFRPVPAE
jgi:MFS family permease